MNKHIKLIISVIFIGFVILMFSMVYIAMKQKDIHLVSKEYYKEEIAYQQTIDALARTPKATVRFQTLSPGTLELMFDTVSLTGRWQGNAIKVELKRPEDAGLDIDTTIKSIAPLALTGLKPGKWKIKVSWEKDAKTYLWQEQAYL